MRFAIYSRKSKFTGKGESIDNQIEMCKNYINLHFTDEPKEIVVFEDEGFSGKNLNRPQFQAMIKEEKNKSFDYIVAYKLDRISRNVADFSGLMEMLSKYNTSFISITEQFDTSTPMGRAMLNIASCFAQLERETIAERIKDNMLGMAKNGKWTGGSTPIGYKSQKQEYIENGKRRVFHTLAVDEEQRDYVHVIFNMYQRIGSLSGLTKYLNDNGFKTQKGNEWDKINIKRVLTNPVYVIADKYVKDYFVKQNATVEVDEDMLGNGFGLIAYNKHNGAKSKVADVKNWIVALGTHQGIILSSQWIAVQNQIQENSCKTDTDKSYSFNERSVLSGILYCKCGAKMRPKIYPSGHMYYICTDKEQSKGCHNSNVNGDILNKEILNEIFKYNVDENTIKKELDKLTNSNLNDDINREYNSLKKKLNDINKSLDNLVILLSKNISDTLIESINKQAEDLSAKKDVIQNKISELENKNGIIKASNDKYEEIVDVISVILNSFDSLSIYEKRKYIQKIIKKVIWNGQQAEIYVNNFSDYFK